MNRYLVYMCMWLGLFLGLIVYAFLLALVPADSFSWMPICVFLFFLAAGIVGWLIGIRNAKKVYYDHEPYDPDDIGCLDLWMCKTFVALTAYLGCLMRVIVGG